MQRLYLFFLLILALQSCKNGVEFEESDPVFKVGDSAIWKEKSYTDSNWQSERGNTGHRTFWIRFVSVIQRVNNLGEKIGIEIYAFGSFEVYWDGVYIGNNGKPAFKNGVEIPGTHSSVYLLPDSLRKPGRHVLALRSTQVYLSKEQRGAGFKIDEYNQLITRPLIISSFMFLMAGGFFVVAIYFFLLYGNSAKRNLATLVFALTCLLFFMLLMAEYSKFYIDIPYTYFYFRLEVIGFLTLATAILIPLYFSIQFKFRAWRWLIAILIASLVTIYVYNFRSYDLSAQLFSACMWVASVILVVNAIFKREKGALIVLAGLLISMVLNFYLLYDFGIFICFFFIVISMLYLHTIRAKQAELTHQSALLESSRLKLELLKKNIQPHFIKNTLTSLIDWVEESPKQGVVFIQALSAEFDVMNEIAEQKLISIAKEIELCKAHLTVMEFRKEIRYHWEENNINYSESFPPAIIHTLLENGITHSLPDVDDCIYFTLSFEENEEFKMYTFVCKAKNRTKPMAIKKSTGFAYIDARLTESYGEHWTFESYSVPEGWCSKIKIFAQ